MENDTASHPTRDQLEAFAHGKLAASEQLAVETHIGECRTCCDLLRQVPHDDLVARLRSADWTTVAGAGAIPPSDPEGPPQSSAMALPSALRNHPRYEIVKQLGAGGMGVVYQAQHRLMGRTVAIKVINGRLLRNEAAVERFRQEVRTAARLSHRNIVAAFDAEQAGDSHFLVMEYVAGTDLAAIVKSRGRLPVLHACNYVLQAAQGLQHAHEQGMVHRDIKPQNLMRTPKGAIKILDFGLARLASQPAANGDPGGLTGEGVTLGTPDYIAPEQARDARRADIRSDIYSLGCTLYYLLTATVPFPQGTAVDKVIAHCEHTPAPLPQLRADIPSEVVEIVERMMAKDPAERYQTPKEIVEALKPFGTPQASPASPVESEATYAEGAAEPALGATRLDAPPARDPWNQPELHALAQTLGDARLPPAAAAPSLPRRTSSDWRLGWRRHRRSLIAAACVVAVVVVAAVLIPWVFERVDERGGGPWTDLLPQVDPARHAVAGRWQIRGGRLEVEAAEWARLTLPQPPAAEYDMEVEFSRLSGANSIALIFVQGRGQASFEIDAWNEHLAGVQQIQGQDLRNNPTRVPNVSLANDRTYVARIQVRNERVEAYLDGKLLGTYRGDGADLSLLDSWKLPDAASLGLGAYESTVMFHRIRVRPVATGSR